MRLFFHFHSLKFKKIKHNSGDEFDLMTSGYQSGTEFTVLLLGSRPSLSTTSQ